MNATLPPLVSGGLPVLGHALEMMRSREDLFAVGMPNMVIFSPLNLAHSTLPWSAGLNITKFSIPKPIAL